MRSEEWQQKIRTILHHNVPKFIKHIGDRGGVSEEEWQWIQSEEYTNPDVPQGMLAMADQYLLHPKTMKKFEKGLFVLVKAIAIMSFCPGGVHLFDLYFSADIEGFVKEEPTRYWYGSSKT